MDTDDFYALASIFGVLFVFTMLDFDVVAKQVRKRLFKTASTGTGGSSGGGSNGGSNGSDSGDIWGWL